MARSSICRTSVTPRRASRSSVDAPGKRVNIRWIIAGGRVAPRSVVRPDTLYCSLCYLLTRWTMGRDRTNCSADSSTRDRDAAGRPLQTGHDTGARPCRRRRVCGRAAVDERGAAPRLHRSRLGRAHLAGAFLPRFSGAPSISAGSSRGSRSGRRATRPRPISPRNERPGAIRRPPRRVVSRSLRPPLPPRRSHRADCRNGRPRRPSGVSGVARCRGLDEIGPHRRDHQARRRGRPSIARRERRTRHDHRRDRRCARRRARGDSLRQLSARMARRDAPRGRITDARACPRAPAAWPRPQGRDALQRALPWTPCRVRRCAFGGAARHGQLPVAALCAVCPNLSPAPASQTAFRPSFE